MPPIFAGPAGQIITALQLFVIATSFSTEANPKTRAQYSKFSRANDESTTWPSRLGMMVIYTPAFFASTTLLALGIHGTDLSETLQIPLPSLAGVLCAMHFLKRCLEVLFLHKYSGRTDRGTPVMISVFYTLGATLIAYGAGREDRIHDMEMTHSTVGTALFVVGTVGNFYHHYLLARLRGLSNGRNDAKKYVAPRGGLFSFVAAPHYLFELIAWLGIAVASSHMNAYLLFGGMASYLGGRSVAQNEFNRLKFEVEDWPADRKNLIPFVF